jgi:hypothetical protein
MAGRSLRAPYASDELVQVRHGLLPLGDSLLSLGFGDLELLLQLLDVAFLVFFTIFQARKHGYQGLDLLLLRNQVLGELDLGGLEDLGRMWVHCIVG